MAEPNNNSSNRKRSLDEYKDESSSKDKPANTTAGDTSSIDWWNAALKHVQSTTDNDGDTGLVHSSIAISLPQRAPYAVNAIDSGTVLFRIPSNCLVCWSNIIKDDSYGKELVSVITTTATQQQAGTSALFHNSTYDLVVATYLASQPVEAKFYLDTLPKGSDFDALPRRWNQEELDYLTGSPLVARINKERNGARSDYNILSKSWQTNKESSSSNDAEAIQKQPLPSFGAFSDSLAAVTSRAFAGFGVGVDAAGTPSSDKKDEDIAMVPILDLCDHSRGKMNVTKNLSYKLTLEGSVIVKATERIEAGEQLRITYGARPNGVLLLNYGFCIPDNVEPDGSSNDALEFHARAITDTDTDTAESPTVLHLRQGPKSHAFHGFINALDQFRPTAAAPATATKEQSTASDENDMPPGFHDDEKEESEGDESFDWDAAMGVPGDAAGEADDDEQEDKKAVAVQLEALSAFRKRLEDLLEQYTLTGADLQAALSQTNNPGSTKNCFAALLVQSEQRIIFFTILIIGKLKGLLGEEPGAGKPMIAVEIETSDKTMMEEQAAAIAAAFVAIRFPFR